MEIKADITCTDTCQQSRRVFKRAIRINTGGKPWDAEVIRNDHLKLCEKHKNQQLNLFCYPCKMLICVKCWFSEDHAEHMEPKVHIVPLEEAFEHYKRNVTSNLSWVNQQKEVINEVLSKVQENEQLITKKKEQIDQICEESASLVAGQATPDTLLQILQMDRKMAELRLNRDETASIRVDHSREFMSEAIELVFHMTEIDQSIQDHGSAEATLLEDGFQWKCKIQKTEGYDGLTLYLCLIEGKPGEYSVQFDNGPEKVYTFEVGGAVTIGTYKPVSNADNNTQKLTAYIRKTYADRIQQLKTYNARLKKQNAEYIEFKAFISNWGIKSAAVSD